MELLDIQQVIVGNEIMTASAQDIKQPVNDSSMHPNRYDSLQCIHCFITFSNPKSKERHMRKNHAEEYKQSLQQTDTIFSCYMCDRVFSSSAKLTQHQASHTKEAKPFRCHYCNGSFPSFSELTNHRRRECKEKHFVCRYCGSVFRIVSQLRSHVLTVHPMTLEEYDDDTNTYRCDKCNRRFQTEEELLHHQETLAGNQNCDVKSQPKKRGRPPKTAAERWMASSKKSRGAEEERVGEEEGTTESQIKGTTHMERPSKEQQPQVELKIPCPENNCDLVFPSVAALRAHKKEMHGPPPPPRKAHPCIECEESYAQPEQLKAHMARAHSSRRHNCSLCGKSFGRESNLIAHQKTHVEGEEVVDKGKR